MLTYDRANELFRLDYETGKLFWRESRGRVVGGSEAGTISKVDGYRRMQADSSRYLAHRIVWLLIHKEWPKDQLDHINRDRSDNCLHNLREANYSQQQANSALRKSKLGIRGVYPRGRKFQVSLQMRGHEKTIKKTLPTIEAAAECARILRNRAFGAYAPSYDHLE